MNFNLKIKTTSGICPEWNSGDAGLDLRASEFMVIPPGGTGEIKLGIHTEFPEIYVAFIKDRSGLARQGRYTHGGVIDSSYRGEWIVLVSNQGLTDWEVKRGDRIAQAVFLPCFHLRIVKADSLSDSSRGVKGFGSTGIV
jgi:dUTP pyrophosphatase